MFSSCTHNFANSLNPAELGQDNRHIWAACQRCRQPGFECYSQLLFRFLLQGILCHGLECLLHINSLLGRCFEIGNVAFRLAPGHCTLLGHLHGQLKKQTQDTRQQYEPGACLPQRLSYSPTPQKENSPDHEDLPG